MPNTTRRWATRLPPRPKVEPIWVLRIRWRTSFISIKPSIPAGNLAHLQIAAAAHLGGDLSRDAARPDFIGIELTTRRGLEYWPAKKSALCACKELQRRLAFSTRSPHPKLFHRKNFIPRADIIQNYWVGGCQTLNLRLVLCRENRQPPSPFGIIHRAVTHDRTDFGQALKVVPVSLHDVFFAVGHRLQEVRARQDHFAQEVGHLLPL